MGQICNTGVTGGGVDPPPIGLLCCSEGVGEKIAPGGLALSTLSLGIPPKVTSIGKGWLERTPYTARVSRPYLNFLSPPLHPLGGGDGVASPHPTPCCCFQWAASDPTVRSTLHSGQCTLWRSLSLYEIPRPVTCRV